MGTLGEMLEYLIFALFSSAGREYLSSFDAPQLPQVEIVQPAKIPQRRDGRVAPQLLGDERVSVLAQDLVTQKHLLAERIDRPQPIASLTKMLTVLLVLRDHELDEVVSVSLESTEQDGAAIGVYEHERLTVQTLVEAALIPSANDAAVALAGHHSGSEAEFVIEMNALAQELGLTSASFVNATGLDVWDEEKEIWIGNQMSARDVAHLARVALGNPFFRETVNKRHFFGTSTDEQFFHEKQSTNQLFDTFLNLSGVKTGYTRLAGQCFVALGNTPDGHEVITVILGSEDRFGETKKLLSWVYDSFEWR